MVRHKKLLAQECDIGFALRQSLLQELQLTPRRLQRAVYVEPADVSQPLRALNRDVTLPTHRVYFFHQRGAGRLRRFSVSLGGVQRFARRGRVGLPKAALFPQQTLSLG